MDSDGYRQRLLSFIHKVSLFVSKVRKSTSLLKKRHYFTAAVVDLALILLLFGIGLKPASEMISPLVRNSSVLSQKTRQDYEVFGFAPYWNFSKFDNIDFSVLTTLAYFGVAVEEDGDLNKNDNGYKMFKSNEATDLFNRAHKSGTRVVLTLTQMDNGSIRQLLNSQDAQEIAIDQSIHEIKNRGIDGINVDFEYTGDPGQDYRNKFSDFVSRLTQRTHDEVSNSKVTVSVYASSVKNPKIYDIASLSKSSDGIFMMAYDFATTSSDTAIPTAPLRGYKEGKYWYDISTAVDDFLTQMLPDKLILGLPWYGYNYAVYKPEVNAQTHKGYYVYAKQGRKRIKRLIRPQAYAQTYGGSGSIDEFAPNITAGWDPDGEVGWKAYYSSADGAWRMIFLEDTRSLSIKYDFAKNKNLAGVGIWALGFDKGTEEFWKLLDQKFGATDIAESGVRI